MPTIYDSRIIACFFPFYSLLIQHRFSFLGITAQEDRDTREGEDVSLECRFAPPIAGKNPKYFWLRTNKRNHDNVAVQDTPLESNYRIDFKPEQGRYDLLISNTSYDRDNGKFECRVKAAGSGQDLHSQVCITCADLFLLIFRIKKLISKKFPNKSLFNKLLLLL